MQWERKTVRELRRHDYSEDIHLASHFGMRMLLRDATVAQSVVVGTNPFAELYSQMISLVGKAKTIQTPTMMGYSSDERISEHVCAAFREVRREGEIKFEEYTLSVGRLDERFAREELSKSETEDVDDLIYLHDNVMSRMHVEIDDSLFVLPNPAFQSGAVQERQHKPVTLTLPGIA